MRLVVSGLIYRLGSLGRKASPNPLYRGAAPVTVAEYRPRHCAETMREQTALIPAAVEATGERVVAGQG